MEDPSIEKKKIQNGGPQRLATHAALGLAKYKLMYESAPRMVKAPVALTLTWVEMFAKFRLKG